MTDSAFGPVLSQQGVCFRLWAPLQERIILRIDGRADVGMQSSPDGWHVFQHPEAGAGDRYGFVLQDGQPVPDPASRFQPQGPHGPSLIVDPDGYAWQTQHWAGRPWTETVLYELHIGTFTPQGTFLAAIEKLDHLQRLGVTAVQLMPISDFPGERGWGYDGVLPYAPYHAYGHPDDMRAFIDMAHARGISVFLDLVYNHFGPDGNFMPAYAPLFTQAHSTPWGPGINFDGEGSGVIREFLIQNALYWIESFRVDGLRFDAVHALIDSSETHIVRALTSRIRTTFPNKIVHLIVENEDNESALLARNDRDHPVIFTAQWNDDIHHVLHTAGTGEDFGYYADYAGNAKMTGRALAEGFAYQGEFMPYRGSERGSDSAHLPPVAFISFIQNHDQVGNRAFGDRLVVPSPLIRQVMAATYLLAPQIPMLFMGEEWDATEPFPYFCDFHEELNTIVRNGRRKELSRLPGFEDEASSAPDPTKLDTFLSAKLRWDRKHEPAHATCLAHYKGLLDVRRREIVPLLPKIERSGRYKTDGTAVEVAWSMDENTELLLDANFGTENKSLPSRKGGRVLWQEGDIEDNLMKGWVARWSVSTAPSDQP